MNITNEEAQEVVEASKEMLEDLGVQFHQDVEISYPVLLLAFMELLETFIEGIQEDIEENDKLNRDLETMHERLEEMAQWNMELEAKV